MTDHISKGLLNALLNTLRNSPLANTEIDLLALQLLAWQKLAANGKDPTGKTPEQAREQSNCAAFVEESLYRIAKSHLPGTDEESAFRDTKAGAAGDTVIRSALNLLTSTPVLAIDYKEVVEAFSETRTGLETLAWVPNEVADLAVELVHIKDSDTVYIPFEGAYRFASKPSPSSWHWPQAWMPSSAAPPRKA